MLPQRTFRIPVLSLIALVLGVGLSVANVRAQTAQQPYSKEKIVELLKGEVSPKRVAELARKRGIDFQITPEEERELRRARADDPLLTTLRQLAPKRPPESPGRGVTVAVPGPVKENTNDGLKYVWIPPGRFMMGCSPGDDECGAEEQPAHLVTITKGFWIGQTAVTVGAYKRFARATGRQMPIEPFFAGTRLNPGWADEAMPVVDVTWDDAQAYCDWVGGRLPTEAEWEYAARAGSTATRYGDLEEIAWYADNSGRQQLDATSIWNEDQANYAMRLHQNGNGMHEVGQKRANGFGLYDTAGNVWEWVNDWYDEAYYHSSPARDPRGPIGGTLRVLRGGSWIGFPRFVRVSYRYRLDPSYRGNVVGFRCGGEVFAP